MQLIPVDIHQNILQSLDELQLEHEIQILLAIESGSRAWGFPSADSDYDVRIVYAYPAQSYLSIFEHKDHLEIPITDELDIAGWDLPKALLLMYGGNAVIQEWLGSPIVYRADPRVKQLLMPLAEKAFNPTSAFFHYLAMSSKKFDASDLESFSAKRLLYAYRSLLAALWIEKYSTAPPILFKDLMDDLLVNQPALRKRLQDLIVAKEQGHETETIQVPENLLVYATKQLTRLKTLKWAKHSKIDRKLFDQVFIELIEK